MEKYGRTTQVTDDNTTWRRKVARVHKHTRNISYLIFSMATMLLQTSLNITLYVHCLHCWHYAQAIKHLINFHMSCVFQRLTRIITGDNITLLNWNVFEIIYLNWNVFVFGATAPQWAMTSSFTRFLDHTQRRTTVGRTPMDEWSARRRDLYLTTHDTHNRQISMPSVGFEPTISAGERPAAARLLRLWVRIS